MYLITRLIGLNILILMVVGTAMLGGKLGIYLDIPSLVMVIGVLIGGALMCFSLEQLVDAFGAVLAGGDARPATAWQRETRIAVFARLYQLAWGGGLVGALTGLIAMLSDLSDPESIGAGMAVALLAPAYGALVAEFVFNPMQQAVMNQRPIDTDPGDGSGQLDPRITPVPPGGQNGLMKGVAMIAVIVTMFMVPIVSFSEIKKEDALSPEAEATYLRYLYGEDAPGHKIAQSKLQSTFDQRQLESLAVYERLHALMPNKDKAEIDQIAMTILAVPRTEEIEPGKSHLWRAHLAEAYYYKRVGAY